ncbi:MAG: DUF1553 domain-containing protein [Verrucomicrobiales bacterium]
MAAFFRNTTQGGLDGNNKRGNGPTIMVPTEEDRPRWESLPGLIAEASGKRDARKEAARPEFEKWVAAAKPEHLDGSLPTEALAVHVPLNEGAGDEVSSVCGGQPAKFKAAAQVSWSPDGKLGPAPTMKAGGTFDLGGHGDFEIGQAFSYGAWIKAGKNGVFGAIMARMDEGAAYRGWDLWQNDRQFGAHIIDAWPDNSMKVLTEQAVLKPGEWQHVFVTYDGSGKPEGIHLYLDGVAQKTKIENGTMKPGSSIRTQTPLRIGQRSAGQYFEGGAVQDVRIYSRQLAEPEVRAIADNGPLRAILAAAADGRTPEQQAALYDHYLITQDTEFPALVKAVGDLEAERAAIESRSPVTHVQVEKPNSEPMANILMRGQYDKVGEQVKANTPAALPPMPEGAPQNRLGLAKWVVAPENPLTARVTVNRFWQEFFGRGIVLTAEDFGIMGTPPSHPGLLDWLAVDFREGGWDVKRLVKQIVTSAAYRQSAAATPEKLEKDRDNALVSRGPRFRMDAEMVRDYALTPAGCFRQRWAVQHPPVSAGRDLGRRRLPGGDTRDYKQDQGENLYRRTLYNFWKRMAPPPNMETFNAPSREVCTVRRERTNTPLQALVTMNDPQFVEAARALAQNALAAGNGDDAATLEFIAQHALCRPLKPAELPILQESLGELRAFYSSDAEAAKALVSVGESKPDASIDPAQLAAWTMLCNQVLNLDEVLNK